MNLIVAVDKNWGIGKNNKLLVSIPADMKFFRETTSGRVVVMGRKTLESFPNGLPLKNRTNIILTKNKDEDIYVIGGDSIYRQFLPYCKVAHVTRIDHAYEADTFFPDLDAQEEWEVTGISEEQTYFDLEYRFYRYEKKK